MREPCPTPDKITYTTWSDAQSALRHIKGGATRIYKCGHHWHLTSRRTNRPQRRRR